MSEYDNEYTEQDWRNDADERERDQRAQDARELEEEPDLERDRRNPGMRPGASLPMNYEPHRPDIFRPGTFHRFESEYPVQPCRACGKPRPPNNAFLCHDCVLLADKLYAEAKADKAVACCSECIDADCPDRPFGCAGTRLGEVLHALLWVMMILLLLWVVVVGWQQ